MHFRQVKRREFMTLLGGAAAWPLAARAQQSAMPVIGLLQIGGPTSYNLVGFRQGLTEAGYVEGQNLAIEYRWANDDPDRLRELAADLVHRRVHVIVAFASTLSVRAAMAVTRSIPIVFGNGSNPVQQGIVPSLNRPGGNVTGMTSLSGELIGKQLGILHELLPQAERFGMLSNSKNPLFETIVKDAQTAGSIFGTTIEVQDASSGAEIDAGLARLVDERHVQGLLVGNDPQFIGQRDKIVSALAHYRLPAFSAMW
jgi:putative ABC transport system substrate-binding protein